MPGNNQTTEKHTAFGPIVCERCHIYPQTSDSSWCAQCNNGLQGAECPMQNQTTDEKVWRTPLLIPGETWVPQLSRAKPRQIVWVGEDDFFHDAVRWKHPGEIETSIMQDKAFRWWIRKTGAKL